MAKAASKKKTTKSAVKKATVATFQTGTMNCAQISAAFATDRSMSSRGAAVPGTFGGSKKKRQNRRLKK
jgi:hypothetical protein